MYKNLYDRKPLIIIAGISMLMTTVFYAGGTADSSLNSDQLVRDLREEGAPVQWVEDYASLAASVLARASTPGALLGMGARDPQITEFLQGLVHHEAGDEVPVNR